MVEVVDLRSSHLIGAAFVWRPAIDRRVWLSSWWPKAGSKALYSPQRFIAPRRDRTDPGPRPWPEGRADLRGTWRYDFIPYLTTRRKG